MLFMLLYVVLVARQFVEITRIRLEVRLPWMMAPSAQRSG